MKSVFSLLLTLCLLFGFSVTAHAQAVARSDNGNKTTNVFQMSNQTSPVDLTTYSVTPGPALCMILQVNSNITSAVFTPTWDPTGANQSFVQDHNLDQSFLTGSTVFYLINPATGNKHLRLAFTGGTSNISMVAITFKNADQTTCIKATDDVATFQGTSTPSQNITSGANDATVAFMTLGGGSNATVGGSQTEVSNDNGLGIDQASGFILGGSTNTHNWTLSFSDNVIFQGVHVLQGSAGPIDTLQFAVQPGNSVGGTAFPSNVVVNTCLPGTVTGPSCSPVGIDTGFTGAVTLEKNSCSSGGIEVAGTATVNAVAGVTTFSGPTPNWYGSGCTILATASGLNPVASSSFNVGFGTNLATINLNCDQTTLMGFYTTSSPSPRAPNDGEVVQCNSGGPYTYTPGSVDITVGGTIGTEIRGAGTPGSNEAATSGGTEMINHCGTLCGPFSFSESPTSPHSPTIENITILDDGGSGQQGFDIQVLGSFGNGQPAVIHHMTFARDISSGFCNTTGVIFETKHGLVHHSKHKYTVGGSACGMTPGFTNENFVDHHLTVGGISGPGNKVADWETDSSLGSLDNITGYDFSGMHNVIMEDNIAEGCLNVTDDSGRLYARFNIFNSCDFGGHGNDSGQTGGRQVLIHNNTFKCDPVGAGSQDITSTNHISVRGGTAVAFSNTFPVISIHCTGNASKNLFQVTDFQMFDLHIGLWPGQYNSGGASSTYPSPHQPGWGYISSGHQNVGSTTHQNRPGDSTVSGYMPPGHDGFEQSLQPMAFLNNTNLNNTACCGSDGNIDFNARMYARSASTTASGTTEEVDVYMNNGQYGIILSADRVGGTAPSISDTCADTGMASGFTYTPINGGTIPGGTTRLAGWVVLANSNECRVKAVVTYDSSSKARAVTFMTLRNVTGMDKNPSVETWCASGCTHTSQLGKASASGTPPAVKGSITGSQDAGAGYDSTTSGSGSGALFHASWPDPNTGGYDVFVVNPGTSFVNGDTIKILGTHMCDENGNNCGTSPTNDLTITVNSNGFGQAFTADGYNSPLSGTLSSSKEIVIGYYALAAPLDDTNLFATAGYTSPTSTGGGMGIVPGPFLPTYKGDNNVFWGDSLGESAYNINPGRPSAPDSGWNTTAQNGTNGATGGDVLLSAIYRLPSVTTSVGTQMYDAVANRDAIAGTITFTYTGTACVFNNNCNLDLNTADFIQNDRELYSPPVSVATATDTCQTTSSSPFNGTTGTGCGTRAFRPSTCTTGVMYFALDDSNVWNTTNNPQEAKTFMGTTYYNGAVDKCTATNTWTNAFIVPATYPYPLALNNASPSTYVPVFRIRRFSK